RRSERVSGTGSRGAARVAAAEAVQGRRARERGLDDSRRPRRLQPVARRLVRKLRARRVELSAFTERGPERSSARPGVRLLQTPGVTGERAREGNELLRR